MEKRKNSAQKLTNLQKIALEGELAAAFAPVNHKYDLLLRLYQFIVGRLTIKKDYQDALMEETLNFIRENTYLDDMDVKKVVLAAINDEPVDYLWCEKVVADIKISLSFGNPHNIESNCLRRDNIKKKVILSAFVLLLKKVISKRTDLAKMLMRRVLKENDLELLHSICFTILSDLSPFPKSLDKTPIELYKVCFNINEQLDVINDIEALENVVETVDKLRDMLFPHNEDEENKEDEEIEIVEEVEETEKGYNVYKSFDGSEAVLIKAFDSEYDAREFVKDLLKKFPKMAENCSFHIKREE